MGENDPGSGQTMALPQGDLRLLRSDVARRLLSSTIPARFAYIGRDGTPRVVPTWFHWTGEELVMPTFLSAPHVRHAAARLGALRANPQVAITIDTDSFPPEVLPMAIIRPLTGSGSAGIVVDMIKQYGEDSILVKMAAVMFGSTETTFYVIAVYFGAVNIRKTRHAVPVGLIADGSAMIIAVWVVRLLFG